MAKFQFPQNPGTNRPNPFQDDTGKNPFGDAGSTVPDAAAGEPTSSPYQASPHSHERPYQPADFQPILPHRASLVLTFGIIAFVLELIGTVAEVIGAFATSELLAGIAYALPVQLLGLVAAIPACIFGRNDIRAMQAGAMRPGGEQRTRIGFRLAIISTILGGMFVVLYIVLLVLDALGIAVNLFGF